MCQLIGANTGGIGVQDATEQRSLMQQRWGGDPYWLRLYDEKYGALIPFFPTLNRQGVGEVFNNAYLIELLGDRSVLDGPFFKEWVEPAGYCDAIGGIVLRSGSRFGTYNLLLPRTRGPSTERDLEIARLYTPHVRRALEISDLLGLRDVALTALDATLDQLSIGVFVVGDDRRVLYANGAAE